MAINKTSRANNYELENCIGKLARVNSSTFALGFLIDAATNTINEKSEVVLNCDTLTSKQNNTLSRHLIQNIFNKIDTEEPLFISRKKKSENSILLSGAYDELFTNPHINNVRYIPICEGEKTYAIVVLVNVEFSTTTKALINIEPFILATVALLKNKKQQSRVLSTSSPLATIDSFTVENNQNFADAVLQKTFHPTLVFNADYKVLKVNAASQRLFNSNIERGWPSLDKLINKTMPGIASTILRTISKYFFLGHLDKHEWNDIELKLNDYQSIKVDLHLFDFKHQGTQCFVIMLNEKLSNEFIAHEYHASLERFNALTEVVPMAILQVDKEWNCSYVNKTWQKHTGQPDTEALGKGWLSCVSPVDLQEKFPEIIRDITQEKSYSGELELSSVDNNRVWVSVHAIGLFNNKYEITGVILTLNDISNARRQSEKLQKMANYDYLTGLSNRSFFNDRLNIALSRVSRHGITAVYFLDLDRFKQINDTLGHPVGDLVIQEVAKRLKEAVRNEDSIARLGGDEFAIIFTDVTTECVLLTIASKIIRSVNSPFYVDNQNIPISCSIGIATSEKNKNSPTDILRRADLALYKAKELGRNQFYFYDKELEKNVSVLNCLRDSLSNLERGDFSLMFQPLINAKESTLVGFEALSRWKHPNYAEVSPDTFIKILEENNLIHEFSQWLFKNVISTIKLWIARGKFIHPEQIAINLSVKQLHIPDFADQLISQFNNENLSPQWVTLEVTETAFIQDPAIAGKNLRKLQSAGFLIALDDFGTGYSSLSLLRQMPLDYIKIDRSFIKDILHDNEAEKIVLAIIGLAKMLNLGVIAEGVDSIKLKGWLIENNCDIHQGFYYDKPLNENNANILLNKSI